LLTRLRASGNLPPNLACDPLFDTLRADARFTKLAADWARNRIRVS
jgi:hypothetical protein